MIQLHAVLWSYRIIGSPLTRAKFAVLHGIQATYIGSG